MRLIASDINRMITRARLIWQELDYAQRRSFELRTGVPAPAPQRITGRRQRVVDL
jgi:hypothetical protein